MALIPMDTSTVKSATATFNTGQYGTIVFPSDRAVLAAVYDSYNCPVIIIDSSGTFYAAYYMRGANITQIPANQTLSVTYFYIDK